MEILPKLLVVEDNHDIADALSQALQMIYDVTIASTGKLALYKTDIDDYDLIILDLGLPDLPGINVCQQLRERGVATPILVLTAESRVLTKINLLDAGANDYLTKPFSLGELKARLRNLLRHKPEATKSIRHLETGDLVLDRRTSEVRRGDTLITLRRKEFILLECLMERAGAVVTREELVRRAWPASSSAMWTNTVDVHIKHLRDKIDRPFGDSLIQTVYGLGYKLKSLQPVIITEI